jgi:4-hydroxythreonine-4-phosphate dehydrogenase
MKHIAITSGDVSGVGLEVTAKALHLLGPQKKTQFFLFRSADSETPQLKHIDKKFNRIIVQSLPEALSKKTKNSDDLFDIIHPQNAPHWVFDAATACHKNQLQGLVTAPLSKTLIQSCGFKAKGHTEILQSVSKTKELNMVFVGDQFCVLLATGHIPLKKVSAALNEKTLNVALQRGLLLKSILPNKFKNKPIALLGLNPHAGESGVLGSEESLLFKRVLKRFPQVKGPLSPDAAFLKQNWGLYSVYVCCYHDQGLIPFKLVHGTKSGYHLTFGLPYVRTSVDHGTAFDLFGKNKADCSSMKEAISACLQLTK